MDIDGIAEEQALLEEELKAREENIKIGPVNINEGMLRAAGLSKADLGPEKMALLEEVVPMLLSPNLVKKGKGLLKIRDHPELLNLLKVVPQLKLVIPVAQRALKLSKSRVVLVILAVITLCPLLICILSLITMNNMREHPGAATVFMATYVADDILQNKGCVGFAKDTLEFAADTTVEGSVKVTLSVVTFVADPFSLYTDSVRDAINDIDLKIGDFSTAPANALECSLVVFLAAPSLVARSMTW